MKQTYGAMNSRNRILQRQKRGHRGSVYNSGPVWWERFAGYYFSSGGACRETRSMRCGALFLGLLGVAAAIVIRVGYLQSGQQQKWLRLAARQHETSIKIDGARGSIFDSANRPLALSIETLTVGVHPHRLADRRETAAELAGILELDVGDVASALDTTKPYVRVASGVAKEKLLALQQLPPTALQIESEFRRHYPQGSLAREILGQVSREGKGQSGIELRYERSLAAPNQLLSVARDARGRFLPNNGSGLFPVGIRPMGLIDPQIDTFEPTAMAFRAEGAPLSMTLDSVVQRVIEEEFDLGREKARAKAVFGMVMDADTGEILALAQAPSGFRKSDGVDAASFFNPEQLRSLTIQDVFEPGSTFKPLIAAAGMNQKVVRPEELINCENGKYKVGKHWIRDVHPVPTVPFSDVLVRSSNVGIAKIGQRLGKENLAQTLKQFGFGRPTGIELPGEERGIVRSLANWKPIDTATVSFGQGISVTAIQLVRAYAALANGGLLVQPTLLKRDVPAAPERILDQAVANKVAEILVGVTVDEHGTGKNAALQGVPVSGKTGTAQKARVGGRGYDSERVLASFIGFVDGAPLGVQKKLVMFVAVDEPGVYPRWGGALAAPVFRRSMERVLSHYLMNHDDTNAKPGRNEQVS